MTCPILSVSNADYKYINGNYTKVNYNNGNYMKVNKTVSWAPEKPVYKHVEKDRYIFWVEHGYGWSIGNKKRLHEGRFYRAGKLLAV